MTSSSQRTTNWETTEVSGQSAPETIARTPQEVLTTSPSPTLPAPSYRGSCRSECLGVAIERVLPAGPGRCPPVTASPPPKSETWSRVNARHFRHPPVRLTSGPATGLRSRPVFITFDHDAKRAKLHAGSNPGVWSSLRVEGANEPKVHAHPGVLSWSLGDAKRLFIGFRTRTGLTQSLGVRSGTVGK